MSPSERLHSPFNSPAFELQDFLGNPVGTCICVKIEGKLFFLTAQHVIDRIGPSANLVTQPTGIRIPARITTVRLNRIYQGDHRKDFCLFTTPDFEPDSVNSFRLAANFPPQIVSLSGFPKYGITGQLRQHYYCHPIEIRAEVKGVDHGSYCLKIATDQEVHQVQIGGISGGAMHVGPDLFGIAITFSPPNLINCLDINTIRNELVLAARKA